jgi:hypothetical protein
MSYSSAFPCYHLPESSLIGATFQSLTFERGGDRVVLEVPVLTEAQLTDAIRTIKNRRENYLKRLRVHEIVDLLDEAVQRWLDPHYELRGLAERWLPVITGYDSEMIRLFLGKYMRRFRKEQLQRMIDEDFPNPLVLDEFRPRKAGGLHRAYGPELTTHIFSGNVPALPLWSIVSGMLLKSATLGKVSSSEPLFPVLFAKTLQEVEPRLAETMAVVWWKGGNEPLEKTAFEQAEAVIAYGSEQATSQISRRAPPGVRCLIHSHKVSFGVIARECLQGTNAWETAHAAARDICWFDQQGCVSPHVFYVERGGKISPGEFAAMLAREMDHFHRRMPRGAVSAEENSAIVQMRAKAEFVSFEHKEVQLFQSETGTAWTVVYGEQDNFPFSALNRSATVVPIDDIADIAAQTAEIRRVVQTVGVACPPRRFRGLMELLGEHGVNRISALGSMSVPEPGWHHDGRFHLADLVRWCDVEASVEAKYDDYDPNRE